MHQELKRPDKSLSPLSHISVFIGRSSYKMEHKQKIEKYPMMINAHVDFYMHM